MILSHLKLVTVKRSEQILPFRVTSATQTVPTGGLSKVESCLLSRPAHSLYIPITRTTDKGGFDCVAQTDKPGECYRLAQSFNIGLVVDQNDYGTLRAQIMPQPLRGIPLPPIGIHGILEEIQLGYTVRIGEYSCTDSTDHLRFIGNEYYIITLQIRTV